MSQQYCLRWNNHQHNLLSVFEDLLHHEAFVDVTLACDGLQLKAHKMVLSACSPYFQSMLYGTPDRHPIVFLRDVRYHEMKALLEFMYRGEVSVDQDNLSSLLKVAEGLKIKGLADVNEQKQQQQAAMAGLLTLQQSPAGQAAASAAAAQAAAHLFPGLLSPNKRPASPPPPPSTTNFLGPKRKRGRPRRLSGSEAVPLASGLVDNDTNNDDLHVQTEADIKVKEEKGMRDGSGEVSPKDTKTSDLISEADSNDGHASGVHSPRALDLSPPGGGANRPSPVSPPNATNPVSATGISHHPDNHQGTVSPPAFQPPVSSAAAAFIAAAAAAAQAASNSSPSSDHENNHQINQPPRARNRRGRGGGSSGNRGNRSERMSAAIGSGSPRSLSEMSVRGLDLLRYATLAPDGTYRCVECERVQISKHFKNKYSFQRHAFLYHEGAARKVFPCSICQKEFSRPDKMKQHLKQAHEGHPKANNVGSNSSKNRAQTPPEEELPPSTLLINPFRGLSDPADMEGKISSIKESGSRI